ncbi:hypothetical protein D3C86_1299080 [compost metagenome]
MKTRLAAPVLGAVLLAGCSLGALAPDPAGGEIALRVTPRFLSAGYAAQAVVTPYTAADVNHLLLSLHTLQANVAIPVKDALGTPITLDVPKADLDKAVVFSRLRPDTTYRVTAQAYKAAGTAASDLISTTDGTSYADVTVSRNDERPAIALSVKLIDRIFNATATVSTILLTEGGYSESNNPSVTLIPGS